MRKLTACRWGESSLFLSAQERVMNCRSLLMCCKALYQPISINQSIKRLLLIGYHLHQIICSFSKVAVFWCCGTILLVGLAHVIIKTIYLCWHKGWRRQSENKQTLECKHSADCLQWISLKRTVDFQTYAQNTLSLKIVGCKHFTADFYHLRVENTIFTNCSCFDPNWAEGVKLWGLC